MANGSVKITRQSAKVTTCAFDILFTKNVPHIQEKIFFSLDYGSYKTCMEVSKEWNELLKSQSFHKKSKTVFHKEILEEEEKFQNARDDIPHKIEEKYQDFWIFTLISMSVVIFWGCLLYSENFEASLE